MKRYLKFVGNLLFIIILSLLLYAFAMFQGGFVSWFLFFSFLPIFLYQIVLLLYPIQNWKVTRSLSTQTVSAGDTISVIIHLKRKLPLPLYYCVFEEIIPNTLKKVDDGPQKFIHLHEPSQLYTHRQVKRIFFPFFRRSVDIPYELKKVPRGEHQLFAIRLRTTDIFGFIKKEHTFQVIDHLLVYPAGRSVRMTADMPSVEQGEISSNSFHLKHTNVISGVREYVAGDKVSWIDWKQTARNQMMMTKEFEQEKTTDVLFLLDHCDHAYLNSLAFEGAVEVSLALMKEIHKQVSRVDFLSIGAETVQIPLDNGEAIYEHLTKLQPSQTTSFSEQLSTISLDIRSYASVFIVTTDINDSLQKVIRKMKKQTKHILIVSIQSSLSLTADKRKYVQQLEYEGITVCLLTETELVNHPLEVNI